MQPGKSLAQTLIENAIANQDKFLDLGNCGLSDDSPEFELLETCTFLEELNLGYIYFDKKHEIVYSKNELKSNNFYSIPKKIPVSIKMLFCNDCTIQKIENLETLINLKEIDLSGNYIQKIENLDSLINLNSIDLSSNKIKKIENLKLLINLKKIDLSYNLIQKIENIKYLINLNSISFEFNEIQKIQNLEELVHLNSLNLSYNQIQKIENLEQLNHLNSINLYSNKIEKIENLKELKILNSINLGSNKIEKIENLEQLKILNSINLDSNKIEKIEKLEQLTNLNLIALGSNKIGKIENLEQLTNLNSLDLNSNKIKKIQNLDKLTNLNEINLHSNKIRKIENLESLINLKELYLSDNQIQKIENLESLINLKELYLYNNQIQKIENLELSINLKKLNLDDNKIQKIENLESLINLDFIFLDNNQILKIENLAPLINLNSIYLVANQIQRIENLESLINLKDLNLDENQIQKIENLESLINLNQIDLSYNNIKKIENVNSLIRLKKIDISHNQIQRIENLELLINLDTINLRSNQIKKIENLEKLVNLNSITLSYNQIQKIENLETLGNLTELELRKNPINNFPQALVEMDNCYPHYIQWLHELQKGIPFENNQSKLLLLGNGNVGKSTLLEALKNGKCTENKSSTHGIRLEEWEHPTLQHNYQVWDFGGQELFFGTHRLFMKGQSIIIIAFDPETQNEKVSKDRINSNELTRNKNVKQWIEIAKKESPNSPIVVVQTKKYKHPESDTEIQKYCVDQNIQFLHVDSVSGENIDEVRFYIQKLTVDKMLDYKMQMPESWNNLRNYFLAEQRKKQPENFSINQTDFNKLCVEYGVGEFAHQAILDYLHNSGIVYYNKDYLSDTIIYDLRWVLDAIYKPFDRESYFYRTLRNYAQGFIQYEDLRQELLKNYPENQLDLFLQFMMSCSVCFSMNKNNNYNYKIQPEEYLVFPEFLSSEKPKAVAFYLESHEQELEKIEITFDYLPSYIIQQYISKYGPYTDKQLYWYTGILIDNQEFTLIESLPEEQKLLFYFKPNCSEKWKNEIMEVLPNHLIKEQIDGTLQKNRRVDVVEDKKEIQLTPIINQPPLKIAISYAKEDAIECEYLANTLSILQAENKILLFYDKEIDENDWDKQIREEFEKCDTIIVLNSAEYNFERKKYIWEVEMPIIQQKLKKEVELSVIRINKNDGITRDIILEINDFKKGVVPKDTDEKAAFYKNYIQEIIVDKILTKHHSKDNKY